MSGGLDRNGDLKDHHSLEAGADPQLSVFNSVLLDGDGRETRFMWRARQILNRRIPADAAGEATYRLPRPAASQGPLRIHARLLFRALPPYTLREHGLEDRLPYLPTFVVDQAELAVPLPPGGR
jgi:hypothetical protein